MPTLSRVPRSPAGARPSRKAISARGSRSASPSETAARRSGSSSRRTPPSWATGTPGNNGKIGFARAYWSAAGAPSPSATAAATPDETGTPVAALRRLYAVVDRLDGDPTMPVSRLDAVAVGPARRRAHVGATPPASGRPRPLAGDDPAEPDRRASVGALGGHGLRRCSVLFEPPDRRRVRPGSPGAAADHRHLSVRLGAVAGLHLRVRLSGLRVQPADPVRVIKDSRRSQSQPLLVELLRSVCAASPGTARLRRRSGPRWLRGPSRSPVRDCVAPPRVRRGW